MNEYKLCRVDELEGSKGSKGFSVETADGVVEMFLVRDGEQVFAYSNSCPHTGATLEWMPDKFLDLEKIFIQCSVHGAIFTIENGLCVGGPCNGQSLEKQQIVIRGGEVFLVV